MIHIGFTEGTFPSVVPARINEMGSATRITYDESSLSFDTRKLLRDLCDFSFNIISSYARINKPLKNNVGVPYP